MDFIQFMKNNGINYRDRRGIAPYTNGSRTTKISAIAIHHSGVNVDQSSEILEGYWGGTLGWGTGGYHVLIRRNAEATVEWNYDSSRISNGVGNHNGYIFNISVEGNANFTDRQNEVLKLVTSFWKDHLGLPYTAILGHNEFSGHQTNTCPGRNMANFRAQINAMATSTPQPAPTGGLSVGSKVTVRASATHYQTGQPIASWVKGKTYTIQQVKAVNQSASKRAYLLSDIVSWVLEQDIVDGQTAPTPAQNSFMVKVTADELNVRTGPGTGYNIDSVIRDKGVYTITATSGDWGKLKSGAGWISLSYTKRV